MIQPDNTLVLFDFSDPAATVDAWAAIDDRVMGGISRSRLRHDLAGHAVFEGTVSPERNGGFASVRSTPGERSKAGASACVIEVRGNPKQFKLNLLTDDGFDSLNYQASFAPDTQHWRTISLPLAAFRASFRGRDVPGAPARDPARTRRAVLAIDFAHQQRIDSNDRRSGSGRGRGRRHGELRTVSGGIARDRSTTPQRSSQGSKTAAGRKRSRWRARRP